MFCLFSGKDPRRWESHKMERAWNLNLSVSEKMPTKHSTKAGGNQDQSQWGLRSSAAAVHLPLLLIWWTQGMFVHPENGGDLHCPSYI